MRVAVILHAGTLADQRQADAPKRFMQRRGDMMGKSTPTPQAIFQIINAFQSSAALKGALELGLFTAIGDERKSATALADALGASDRGVRILCDFLVINGLLEKEGVNYRCSPEAALFLDESSPAYFGTVGRFMLSPDVMDAFSDIASVVRKGGTLLEGAGTVEPENPIWVEFARSMVPLMQPSADFIGDLVTRHIDGEAPTQSARHSSRSRRIRHRYRHPASQGRDRLPGLAGGSRRRLPECP